MKTTKSIFLSVLVVVLWSTGLSAQVVSQELPPSGFCQAKVDYDNSIVCSEGTFVANNQGELDSYLEDFGLSDGKYRNLRVNFNLTGETSIIHSPCKISLGNGKVHTVDNLCLDGRGEVVVENNTVF